jgi:pimeloyl-ACP methyl ester carboxylesterase
VSAAQLNANPDLVALNLTASNGYEHYIIQYVSEGPVGTVRRVTAMVYVPDNGARDLTLVAVNHGTSGLGQPCGPSHNAAALGDVEKMTLPMLAQGYAVVATDYAGIGVRGEPLSPYTVGHAEALAVLDGVRAMWNFHDRRFDAAQLNRNVFLLGHSQGGQATLFAHQDFDTSVGGKLLGSVSFAPAIGDERLYRDLLGTPLAPTNVVGVVMTMSLYGHTVYGGEVPASWLSVSAVDSIPDLFATECIADLLIDLPKAEPTIGQLFTPSFVAAGGACGLDGGACPSFEPWNSELLADEPGSFTSSAPTLILQGGADTTVPAIFTSCIQARLVANNPGTPDLGCLYLTDTHPTIVVDGMVDALNWMHSVEGGAPATICPKLIPLPANCLPL